MSPQRIQRKRTRGWRMPEGAVYVGRGSKFGNPFEYRTPQGLVRYRPEAPEEWEYEGRISAHGATHPYYGPDGTVTDYRVRYATRGELVRMYRRTILDPDRGMLGAYPSNGGHLLTVTTEVIRAELRGKDLSCWCAPDLPCHADVLLELANAGEPS